jgi:signal transduction histidine kinase
MPKLIDIPRTRWLSLCVLALMAAFVASTAYSWKVAAQIEGYAGSITKNSAPGVVYLATVTEDVRLMSTRAMRSRSESVSQDREQIAAWGNDVTQAIDAYRRTEDYPGERELYTQVEKRLPPFLSLIEDTLAYSADHESMRAAVLDRLNDATNDLAASIRELTLFNADHVANEGAAIAQIRRDSSRTFTFFRAISLALAVAGLLLSSSASRQHIALAESSRRLAEGRANELEMFAGRVAHDLRAPLTVIQMRSSIADRTDATGVLKDALDRIRLQTQRMGDMIDALLAFAQSGARTQPGRCAAIAEVVDEVVSESRSLANDAEIECVVEPIPRAAVACSSSVLEIVLTNLVRNAVKYIGYGGGDVQRITVRVRERNEKLLFEVDDTGPGLPPGTEDIVFEPFVRLGSGGNGIGLGLATVKRLVEAHAGKVGVESVPRRGCRFWFELPRASDAAPSDEHQESTPSPSGLRAAVPRDQGRAQSST